MLKKVTFTQAKKILNKKIQPLSKEEEKQGRTAKYDEKTKVVYLR